MMHGFVNKAGADYLVTVMYKDAGTTRIVNNIKSTEYAAYSCLKKTINDSLADKLKRLVNQRQKALEQNGITDSRITTTLELRKKLETAFELPAFIINHAAEIKNLCPGESSRFYDHFSKTITELLEDAKTLQEQWHRN